VKIAGLLLAIAMPAMAVAQVPAPTADVAVDPARLAAATQVVDQLWPLGTYRRMMQGTMSKMMESVLGPMLDMRSADLPNAADSSNKATKKDGNRTLGELAAAKDPYFRERMRITMDTMTTAMIPLLEKIEPHIREALSTSYARRFSVQQLADMNAFFKTPSGRAYAEQAMMIFVDPEMMRSMMSFAPEMLKAMPDILTKVQAATAHLPPPPKPDTKK
jgi:hypothetical protein